MRRSLTALLILTILAGCSSAPKPAAPPAAQPAPQAAARKITVGSIQEPRSLLPHFDLLSVALDVDQMVFDCLLSLNEKGEYVSRLADPVPTVQNGGIAADGKTYTFKLRKGVTWQDGKPFSADDVKFTWDTIMNKDLPIVNRTGWNQVSAVEVSDPQTVTFKFNEPNAVFMTAVSTGTCYILPKHLLSGQDLKTTDFGRKPVGTGPFKFAEWASGSYIRLTRNPNYWQSGKPEAAEVVYRIIPSTEGLRAALERGEIDLRQDLSMADRENALKLADYNLVTQPSYNWWHFWLNTKDPILSDKRVRQALSLGTDKKTIVETVMRGAVQPLYSYLPPNHWAHNPDVKKFEFNLAQAKALLDEAGWKPGAGGIREKNGLRLSLEITNISGDQERLQVIQIVQQNWASIGVEAKIKTIDAASFPPTVGGGKYQIAYGSFGERHDPMFNLWTNSNWTGWENPSAPALMKTATSNVDRNARITAIKELQTLIAEDQPNIPLAPRPSFVAAKKNLKGFAPSMAGTFWNIADWK